MLDDLFTITHFLHHSARSKSEKQYSLTSLAETIEAQSDVAKDLLPWLKFAIFGPKTTAKGSLRHDDNVLQITGCESDYDGEQMSFDDAVTMLREHHIACVIHTSPSHTPEKPRWRVLCPCSRSYPPDHRARFVARVNGALGGVVGPESFTLSQSYLYGHLDGGGESRVIALDGRYIDQCDDLDAIAVHKTGKAKINGGEWQAPADIEELTRRILSGEELHPSALSIAGSYAGRGSSKKDCLDYIGLAFTAAHQPRYGGRWDEILAVVDWVYAKEEAKKAKATPAQPGTARIGNAEALMDTTFDPLKWVIPRYIPEGCTLISGKPKVGKSWLMLAAALAIVRGDEILGEAPRLRRVLYCALEDNERRLHHRIGTIVGSDREGLKDLLYLLELPRLGKGCAEELKRRVEAEKVELIIIDTLAAVAGVKARDETQNAADYRNIAEFTKLNRETGVDIIIVHHLRKQSSDDVFDTISGTLGIAAAADHLVVLDRPGGQLRLATRGRDAEPEDKSLDFDGELGVWTVLGDFEGKVVSKENETRDLILSVITGGRDPVSPAIIIELTKLPASRVKMALKRMVESGQVKRTERGMYEAPWPKSQP